MGEHARIYYTRVHVYLFVPAVFLGFGVGVPGLIALRSIAPLPWHDNVQKHVFYVCRGAMERSAISPGTPK